jgi:branched-chain amino acid transport system permease protein
MGANFIDAAGVAIEYVTCGSGEPVIYLHGNLASLMWYEKVMDLPGCRTIALSLPNFGGSGPMPGEVDIDRYADFLGLFIERVSLGKAPILVGHSLGGAVAISLAVRRPELVRALVLVDSAAPSGLKTPEERHPLIEMMRTNRDFLAKALAPVAPTLTDQAFFARLVDDATRMAAPAWIGNAVALGRFNYAGRCSAFAKPVLVLWGDKDVIVTEAMARETVSAFPAARLEVLDGVGHSAMAEDPRLFLSTLEGFRSGLK